jgi:hypothetical protein
MFCTHGLRKEDVKIGGVVASSTVAMSSGARLLPLHVLRVVDFHCEPKNIFETSDFQPRNPTLKSAGVFSPS